MGRGGRFLAPRIGSGGGGRLPASCIGSGGGGRLLAPVLAQGLEGGAVVASSLGVGLAVSCVFDIQGCQGTFEGSHQLSGGLGPRHTDGHALFRGQCLEELVHGNPLYDLHC